jgi:hypothetical protein
MLRRFSEHVLVADAYNLSINVYEMHMLFRFNERVLVQEMADSYNTVINNPLSWPLFRGPFTYQVPRPSGAPSKNTVHGQTLDRQTLDRQTLDTTNPGHDKPRTRQTPDTTNPGHNKPWTQ